ncbi:MAG: DUF6962 family protein [Gemmatimonadales bacterium]
MIRITDPDVVFTDLALAVLAAVFAWRLRRAAPAEPRPALLMAGLASAAFFGAVFHGGGAARTVWLAVALSIVVVTAMLLSIALSLRARVLSPRAQRGVVAGYAVVFAAAVVFVDDSFRTIVRFYGPAVLVAFVVAALEALRRHSRPWALIAAGLGLSIVAAVLQRAAVGLHPTYFDHNAVYHVVQAAALIVLYLGFRRADVVR